MTTALFDEYGLLSSQQMGACLKMTTDTALNMLFLQVHAVRQAIDEVAFSLYHDTNGDLILLYLLDLLRALGKYLFLIGLLTRFSALSMI